MADSVQRQGRSFSKFFHSSKAAITLAIILAAGIALQSAQAQTYKILHGFRGAPNDGASPLAGVILDAQGNMYGTTAGGGNSTCGCGTVFKLDTNGVETVLYNFTGSPDGGNPSAGLIFDAAGNLYGTTTNGGTGGCSGGCGTVFKLDTTGVETVPMAICTARPTKGAAE